MKPQSEEEILNLLDVLEEKIDMLIEQIKEKEIEIRLLEDEAKEAKAMEVAALKAERYRIDKIIEKNLKELSQKS